MVQFNLAARISLDRNVNTKAVVSSIQKELSRHQFKINIAIDNRQLFRIEGILNRNARAADSLNSSLVQVNNSAKTLGTSLSGQKFSTANIKAINSELATSKRHIQSLDSVSTKTFTGIAAQSYLAYRGISLLTNAFNEFREYNSVLTKFAQVSQVSISSVSDLSKAVRKTAIAFGVNSQTILESAVTLKRAGLSTEKVKESLELLSKLSLTEGVINLDQMTKSIIVMSRVFNLSGPEIEDHLNRITNLSAKMAFESEDIAVAVGLVGPIFRQLGGNLNELIAIQGALIDSTQLSSATISQSLKTIFTRISAAPETINKLKEFGIELTDLQGRFVGPAKAVEILHDKLSQLDDLDTNKLSLLQSISGTRQISVLSALLQSYGKQLEAKSLLQEKSNKLDLDAAIAQDSLKVKLQSTAEVLKGEFATLFESRGVTTFTDSVLGLTKAFSGLLPILAPLVPVFAALGAKSLLGRSGIGAGLSGIGSSIGGSFAAGYNQPTNRAVPSFPRLPSPNVATGTIQKNIYAKNPHFQHGLGSIGGAFGDAFNKKNITQQVTTVNKLSGLFADMSLTEKQLSGGMKHLAIQLNDGVKLEDALNNTRAALARVQAKQAAALGISLNNSTSYAGTANKGGVFGGLKNLYASHGNQIAQGGAGLGLLLNGQFNKGASQQLVETGLSTGLGASVLGANPATSAVIGLGAAVLNYSDIIEGEARRIDNNKISSALDSLAIKIKLDGDKLGPGTLESGKGVLSTLNEALANSRREVGTTQAIIAGTKTNLGHIFSGEFGKLDGSVFGATNKIQDDRSEQFQQTLRQSADSLLQFRSQILASGVKSISEFEGYGQGFGKQLLDLLEHLDPAVRRTTEALIQSVDSKQLQQAIATNLANSISKSTVEVDAKRRSLSPAYRIGSGRTDFDSAEIGTSAYGRQVGKLGLSKQISGTLKDLNLVSKVAPGILAEGKDFGKDSFAESIGNQLKLAGVGNTVASIAESLERNGFDEFKKSLENIDKASKDLISGYEPLINSTERLAAANLELVNARNENVGKASGQLGTAVDASIQARLAELNVNDSITRYRKGTLDTSSGNALAKEGAKSLTGSSDTTKLGDNLKRLGEAFEKTKDVRFLETIKQTEAALKLLGDTTLRTRNIEEELNKAKGQKESKLGLAGDFLSKDLKGRREALRGAALAGVASKAGTLTGFTIEQQQRIIETLKSFGDIKIRGGISAKDEMDRLLKNTGGPGLVGKEEADIAKLTRESILISADAAKASRELATNQERIFTTFVSQLGEQNREFLSGMKTLLGVPERLLGRASGGYVSGGGTGTSDSIPARLSNGEYVIKAAAVSRLGVGYLDSLNMAGGGSVARQYRRQQYLQGQFNKTDAYIRSRRPVYEYPNRQSQFQDYSERFANFRNTTRLQRKYNNPNYGKRFAEGGLVGGNNANFAGVSASIDRFHSSVLNLSNAISRLDGINIPSSIEHHGSFTHEVIINGGQVLNELLNGPLASLMRVEIQRAFQRHLPLEQRISPIA